jgi:hypothetical protein
MKTNEGILQTKEVITKIKYQKFAWTKLVPVMLKLCSRML